MAINIYTTPEKKIKIKLEKLQNLEVISVFFTYTLRLIIDQLNNKSML